MGHDITFHPVSRKDLQRYVFDIADDPSLAADRAAEVASNEVDVTQILELYGSFPVWLEKAASGETTVSETFAFACAAIAGYRHPFWFARGCAVGFLVEDAPAIGELFQPIPTVASGRVSELPDSSAGVLTRNNAASGIVRQSAFDTLRARLSELETVEGEFADDALHDVFGDAGLDALNRAIRYADQHGLDLIEGSEVVIPALPKTYTHWNHMRAHYLGKLDP